MNKIKQTLIQTKIKMLCNFFKENEQKEKQKKINLKSKN